MNAPVPMLDTAEMLSNVSRAWDDDLVKQLSDYIEIPAKSPAFDPDWAKACLAVLLLCFLKLLPRGPKHLAAKQC
jgi:hypothetical protein